MAHQTKIGDSFYEVTGGKVKVVDSIYEIKGGKTKIGDSVYDIKFLSEYAWENSVWTLKTYGSSESVVGPTYITFGGGKFITTTKGTSGYTYWYTDGESSWTSNKISATASADGCYNRYFEYGNNMWVCFTADAPASYHYPWVSTDGLSWTKGTGISTQGVKKFMYVDKWYALAYKSSSASYVYTSTDGKSWTSNSVSGKLVHFAYGNGKFVYVTDSTTTYYYGTSATSLTKGTLPCKVNCVYYLNDKFIAYTNWDETGSSSFCYSTDGINWTQGTFPISGYMYEAAYGNGRYFIGADSNAPLYSEDGINWSTYSEIEDQAATHRNSYFTDFAYGNNMWLVTNAYKQYQGIVKRYDESDS